MKIKISYFVIIFIVDLISLASVKAANSMILIDPLIERSASYDEIAKAATKIEMVKMCGNYVAYYFEGYTRDGAITSWCCIFLDKFGSKTLVDASRGNCYHGVNQGKIEGYCSYGTNE